ncbi:hypothetical protein [Metabacillus idriensis]|nr:hypothetical protein [Metabacillus idriensis]
MEQKPLHYDGSVQAEHESQQPASEPFQITDEMRKNLGSNPYFIESGE